ncbi:DUF6064 family protein [Aromatoleum sp.]|uniref:DUF6064 family protein n=1 Tax=Aromatoleum sp. TaxID=2307007 RepID=UPI002FC9234A
MNFPFTKAQFFDVFAAYNNAVWPAQFVLAFIAIALLVLILLAPRRAGRFVAFGLAVLWAWLALVYHLAFFWAVNPTAPLFAAVSLGAAGAFVWSGGIRNGLVFESGISSRRAVGLLVILYALALYPVIGESIGHRYPRTPTFGLPCPTTLYTFGILLMASPGFSRTMVIGPLVWSLIGAGAAFALDVPQDFGLVVVAVLGVYLLFVPVTKPVGNVRNDGPDRVEPVDDRSD